MRSILSSLRGPLWAVKVYSHPGLAARELCWGGWLYCQVRLDLYRLFNFCPYAVVYPVLTQEQAQADGLLGPVAP